MPTNNPTQPDRNTGTAEAKIREILYSVYGATLSIDEAVQQLKALLVDARLQELRGLPSKAPFVLSDETISTVDERRTQLLAALQQTRQEEACGYEGFSGLMKCVLPVGHQGKHSTLKEQP